MKKLLIMALLILHIPHISRAEPNNLGQAFVIGAWAISGATLLTIGSYNLLPTGHVTIKEFFDIAGKKSNRTNAWQIRKITKNIPFSYPSFTEILKNACVCATGAGILLHAWKLAKDT